ncbi:MAG: hypothetical protein Q4C70_04980 [Planctomycetia bacterium]|nr:hypothetical protein [Planctomycetia bacterium]
MKIFRFFVLLFGLLASITLESVFAQEVESIKNAPEGEYIIKEGMIYTLSLTATEEVQVSNSAALFSCEEDAQAYYDGLLSIKKKYPSFPFPHFTCNAAGVFPVRFGASSVVQWCVLSKSNVLFSYFTTSIYANEISAAISELKDVTKYGGSVNWFMIEVTTPEYGTPEPDLDPDPEPSDPENADVPFDATWAYYNGEWLPLLSSWDTINPNYSTSHEEAETVVSGLCQRFATEADAEKAKADFANFYTNFNWSAYGYSGCSVSPTVSEVYKTAQVATGNETVYSYCIFYTGVPNADNVPGAFRSCVESYTFDYLAYNMPSGNRPASPTHEKIVDFYPLGGDYAVGTAGTSTLAGQTLATAADSDDGPLQFTVKNVNFQQNTTSAIAAEEGDYAADVATVASTVSASEDGTTINITNNTEVNTNLELGDAPDAETVDYTEVEEKTVKDSEDLLSEQQPTYTYIDTSSTEWKIDYQKLWNDCKEKFDEFFGTEDLTNFFEGSGSGSSTISPYQFTFIDPWIGSSWWFTLDFATLFTNEVTTAVRSVFSFFCYLFTTYACIRLFA